METRNPVEVTLPHLPASLCLDRDPHLARPAGLHHPSHLVSLWISWYYDALAYTFTTNEIVWRRGVWFRRTGIVPYNRITNIDLIQGPLMRWVGVSTLKVQTAGYSAPSGASSEIRIEGTDQPEDLRSLIMGFVRGYNPVAVQTCTHEEQSAFPSQILAELVQIRRLLEEERER
jgi:hypothetical protein